MRAKATPNGMVGYLVGKIVMFALTTLVSVVVLGIWAVIGMALAPMVLRRMARRQ